MNVVTDPQLVDAVLDRGTIVEILPKKDKFREQLMSGKKLKFYIGIDATAPTLHLSHAKNFMLLERFRKLGHEVIVLFGDFTARIGDPSDRNSARNALTRESVLHNIDTWKRLILPVMDFEATDNPPLIKYNHDWLSKLSFEDVIKLAGNFTVQQMLERDMFEKRIKEEKPIFLHEFFYPLMQGYDSVAMEVDVELCGTDQIFNALAGRTLERKLLDKEKSVVAVTLMENPKTGELMSKSNGTGVFLDTTANDMYGQVMSQGDEMIPILFTHCTDLPLDEIEKISNQENQRDAKMLLAHTITKIFHKQEGADKAQDHFINTIQNKNIPDEVEELIIDQSSITVIELLKQSNLVTSNSEARRVIDQKGVKIDQKTVESDRDLELTSEGFVLQKGKRFFIKVKKA
jgi:tyrosyl-tRNA synthetase